MGAMIESVPMILCLLGLALLFLEYWATRVNRKLFRSLSLRDRLVYQIGTSIAGILLVYGSLYPEYGLRSDLRVFGVPFVTTAWQFERGRWLDYTGALAVPAFVGNALVAFLLPQLFVAGARWIRRNSS
jgi:hypothetical protein